MLRKGLNDGTWREIIHDIVVKGVYKVMNLPDQTLRSVLFGLKILCILFVLLEAIPSQATTYYVATSGSDSNPGTSDRPWRNPQKCANSPIKAGDTCLVRSGTYTAPSGKFVIVNVGSSSPSGTASQPITIKSEKPLGAVLVLPNVNTSTNANGAFWVSKPYYVIEGFDITGGTASGISIDFIAIIGTRTATGLVIRSNSIHHIARSVCSNSVYGFDGIFLGGTPNALIERNRIYAIGRRRNGESGCSTNKFMQDHGIYINGATNLTIRRNVIYDTNRGFPINIKSATVTVDGVNIYHNTISGKSPTGSPNGQIAMSSTLRNIKIRNNVFYDPPKGYVFWWSNLSISGLLIDYNLSNSTNSTLLVPYAKPTSGITYTSNITGTNPAFINSSSNDFRLTSSSPAINRGTSSGVPTVPDGRPDMAAYEYSLQNTISSPLTPTGVKAK